ncbi:hypothetical protein MU439_05950 [Methanonatronarchaeum sp. AMET6-2]|nr:hypothetical protein MU439_05950 [Methanonatronarchaeum sp. AMET6-2]
MWLEFLINKVGHSGLEETLEYYHKVGWISNEALEELLKLSSGLGPYIKNDEWEPPEYITKEEADIAPDNKFAASDHIKSLVYIEKIAGRDMDLNALNQLKTNLNQVERATKNMGD